MSDTRSTTRGAGRVAILLALAFAALYAAISRGVFLYGDDVLMYQVTEAIVERGEVAVTTEGPPRTAVHSIPGVDGRRYAKYGIAQSLVAIPFYAASGPLFDRLELPESRDRFDNVRTGARVFGTGLLNAVLGGAGVAICFLLASALGSSAAAALGAAVLLGCATLWPHYSATFLSEPLAGVCLAVSVLAAAKFERAHPGKKASGLSWLAISGFAAGALVATKVVMALVLWPIAVWIGVAAFRSGGWRRLLGAWTAWGLPLAAWLATIALYNLFRFGSALETGYEHEAKMFTSPFLRGLGGLLFSPTKGIGWYCPAVLIAFAGLSLPLWGARRRSAPEDGAANLAVSAVVFAGSATLVLVLSTFYQWYGGGAWGPRFLAPLLPLWMAFAAPALDAVRRSRWPVRFATGLLIVASLAATLAGVVVPFDRDAEWTEWGPREVARAAWKLDRSPLLENLEELPRALAVAASKLAETEDSHATGEALAADGIPDFAFVRYGSHALLTWTRASLVAFALLLAAATFVAAGGLPSQKALSSSPPQ